MTLQQISTGGYVRHRDRMVQESVFEDLKNTLIACRWMAGTTTRKVVDPYAPSAGWQIVTTTTSQVLKLVGKREDGDVAEVVLIDYFPEAGGNDDEAGESRKTELNTLAVDDGVPQEGQFVELGSNMMEQPYVFTMAFYASSDAVAKALLNDLRDRYNGRLVSDDHLNIYNYNDPTFDADTLPVVRAEIDFFRFEKNSNDQVTPWEVHLYFAELTLTDVVDPREVADTVPPPAPSGPSFRSAALGEDIAYDSGQDALWTFSPLLIAFEDPGGDHAFVELPLISGTTYVSDPALDASPPDLLLLGQWWTITANDESAIPLADAPVGSFLFLQGQLSLEFDEQNILDNAATYGPAGLTIEPVGGFGVLFPIAVTPTVTAV